MHALFLFFNSAMYSYLTLPYKLTGFFHPSLSTSGLPRAARGGRGRRCERHYFLDRVMGDDLPTTCRASWQSWALGT